MRHCTDETQRAATRHQAREAPRQERSAKNESAFPACSSRARQGSAGRLSRNYKASLLYPMALYQNVNSCSRIPRTMVAGNSAWVAACGGNCSHPARSRHGENLRIYLIYSNVFHVEPQGLSRWRKRLGRLFPEMPRAVPMRLDPYPLLHWKKYNILISAYTFSYKKVPLKAGQYFLSAPPGRPGSENSLGKRLKIFRHNK